MTGIELKPGDRVRCVDAEMAGNSLTLGKEYALESVRSMYVSVINDNGRLSPGWLRERFKPIVRVKAPTRKGCCNKACAGCRDWEFRANLHKFAVSGQ